MYILFPLPLVNDAISLAEPNFWLVEEMTQIPHMFKSYMYFSGLSESNDL